MIVSTPSVGERLTPSSSSWSKRRQKKHVFGLNWCSLGAPRKVLKVSSPAGSSLEMKPGARVACRVTMAVVFLVLLVTAIAFAGECRGAHHGDNVSVPSPRLFGSLHLGQVQPCAPDGDKIKARRCPLQVRASLMSAKKPSPESQTHLLCGIVL